jgi:hypothetical protein
MKDWLTPQDVGKLIGFSAQFVRMEIKAGELHAEQIWSRGGKIGRYRIARSEAESYARRIKQRGPEVSQTSATSNRTPS